MSFPRYPTYKPSGVEWLGEVPEHWEVKRVRRIFEIKKRIAGELGFDILSITQQGIKVRDPESNDGQVSMDYSKYQVVEPGDFAMNHMDLLTGYVDISRRLGVTSPDYRVFSIAEPNGSDPGYLLNIFQMGYKQKILYAYGQGSSQLGRWRLPTEEFQDWAIPFPSLEEQASIATFLDHETAKIDALIAEQQRLIELLQEKRQAVISHAVTKGLNPDAPMKDSGVEWLGEVPEHWEVVPLKNLIQRGTSISYGIVQPGEPLEHGIPFVQTTNMSKGDFSLEVLQRTSPEIALGFPRSTLTGGEVLLGIRASIGAAHVAPAWLEGANLSRGVARIMPSAAIMSHYLVFYLRSEATANYWLLAKQGSTFNEVSIETVKNLRACLPSIAEQVTIVSHVDQLNSQFNNALGQSIQLINLLQERRSALISAAVTGQIDVRGLVPEAEAA